MILRED